MNAESGPYLKLADTTQWLATREGLADQSRARRNSPREVIPHPESPFPSPYAAQYIYLIPGVTHRPNPCLRVLICLLALDLQVILRMAPCLSKGRWALAAACILGLSTMTRAFIPAGPAPSTGLVRLSHRQIAASSFRTFAAADEGASKDVQSNEEDGVIGPKPAPKGFAKKPQDASDAQLTVSASDARGRLLSSEL